MLGPLRLFDNVGGGVLGAVTGLALCWAVGAVLLYLPRQTELRHYAQDSAILSRLNEELPPHRLIDTLAQIDPFAALAGPAAGVEPPDPAVLDAPGVSSCGAERRASRRQRLRARDRGLGLDRGQRARRHERPRRCRNRHAPRRPQRRRPARRADRLVRQDATTSPCSASPGSMRRRCSSATRAGDTGRAARLPGQRPLRRDGRPRRPHRADRRPRRLRQLPGQPRGDDDSRRHSQRQLGRPGRRCAGPRDHDRLRPARRHGRRLRRPEQRVSSRAREGGHARPSTRPAPTARSLRATGRARPRAA